MWMARSSSGSRRTGCRTTIRRGRRTGGGSRSSQVTLVDSSRPRRPPTSTPWRPMARMCSCCRARASVLLRRYFVPPRWSPDGRRLAFAGRAPSDPRTANSTIYRIGADGSDQRRLTAAVSGPSWSPDGERLAFAKPDGAEVALYTIAADGSDAQRVTIIPGTYWHPQYGEPDPTFAWIEIVAWSPDGEHILYTCGPAVCVVEVDGTPVGRSPINLTGQTTRPAAAWSPDGARIAIVTRASRSQPQGARGRVHHGAGWDRPADSGAT